MLADTFRKTASAFTAVAAALLLTACQGTAAPGTADEASSPVTAATAGEEAVSGGTSAATATTAASPDPDLPAGAAAAAEAIDGEDLRRWVAALSSDDMQGRGPGSEGDRLARRYLIDQMKALGLQPGGPGGQWEQPFHMVGIEATVPATWTFHSEGAEPVSLERREEFVATSGVQAERAVIDDAELVFAGYGIEAPEYQWDDFKGADLAGKVLLMLNNDPDWDPELFGGERRLYYGRWSYKYESAARQGAVGAIVIHTVPSAGYPYQVVQTSWSGEQFQLPAGDGPRLQIESWVTEDAARRIATLAGRDLDELVAAARSRDFRPVPLGLTTSLELTNEVRRTETANVLGLLPGSDPELDHTVVAYSAHHDHLGIGDPDDDDDRIFNGALDNASGSAQLLAIAKAFTRLPERPRRSILLAFVGAEEQGLLGSKYYASHPTVAPGDIAAVLNYDGGNIWGRTRDVTFVGLEKSDLGDLVREHAARQGRTVKPDQFPDRGFYYRSDQFSFAKIGVPGVYLDGGTDFVGRPEGWGKEQIEAWEAEHYHQQSDELTGDWSFDGMVDDARLGFFVGLEIAESEVLPAWTPGDEFEAARREALAAVGRR